MAKGKDGLNGQVLLRPGTKREAHVGGVYESMATNEVLINQSGGGGGWGNPLERDVNAVLDDVRNGFVTVNAAKLNYGVVIDGKGKLDEAATAKLRKPATKRKKR